MGLRSWDVSHARQGVFGGQPRCPPSCRIEWGVIPSIRRCCQMHGGQVVARMAMSGMGGRLATDFTDWTDWGRQRKKPEKSVKSVKHLHVSRDGASVRGRFLAPTG
jgi:hypothetical protein